MSAPSLQHEDYRFHHFDQGFDCQGSKLKNWLFVIPDGVAQSETAEVENTDTLPDAQWLNSTNLRTGNLRSISAPSAQACDAACEKTDACKAWVFDSSRDLCFLKAGGFCVNTGSSGGPCGGCETVAGKCPCTAGIKGGSERAQCPAGHGSGGGGKTGRACGRMGFASETLIGPYKFCQWLEQPNPQGLDDPGGPGSNCDSWPGDIIQSAKDGSLYFVNGWGNIYRAPAGTLKFERLPGNATIARPAPAGQWDDLHQIEFTFLPPREKGGRWRLYHASYANATANPLAKKADYGYKQAIGMYSFTWDDAEDQPADPPPPAAEAPVRTRDSFCPLSVSFRADSIRSKLAGAAALGAELGYATGVHPLLQRCDFRVIFSVILELNVGLTFGGEQ